MKNCVLLFPLAVMACCETRAMAQVFSDKEVVAGEAAFLKTRQAMSEVHCRFHYKNTVHSANQKQLAFTMELWASGDRLREDLTRKVRITTEKGGSAKIVPDESGGAFREVACIHCEKMGQFFSGDEVHNSAKDLGPIGNYKRRIAMMFHPNLVGITGCSIRQIYSFTVHSNFQSSDRTNFRVANETLDGVETVKLRWINAHGAQITTWLDPNRGYFPLQFEARAVKNEPDPANQTYAISKNLDIKPAKGDGTLFPRRIQYMEFDADDKLSKEEEVTIEEIEIGRKIDPAVFTIAGCNLGDSYYIQNADRKQSGVWNADLKKVEPLPPERMQVVTAEQIAHYKDATALVESPVPFEPQSRRDWIFWLSGGLIAAAAVWFVARMVAKRRSSP